jgi:hypothetical protein
LGLGKNELHFFQFLGIAGDKGSKLACDVCFGEYLSRSVALED